MSLSLEEISVRRAEMRSANDDARAAQHVADMAEVLRLEEEHGYEAVEVVQLARWAPGATTLVAAKIPRASDNFFKRYRQTAGSDKASAGTKIDAGDQFSRSCLLYPHPKNQVELFEATINVAPGLLGHVALQLVLAVQGREIEEGK